MQHRHLGQETDTMGRTVSFPTRCIVFLAQPLAKFLCSRGSIFQNEGTPQKFGPWMLLAGTISVTETSRRWAGARRADARLVALADAGRESYSDRACVRALVQSSGRASGLWIRGSQARFRAATRQVGAVSLTRGNPTWMNIRYP